MKKIKQAKGEPVIVKRETLLQGFTPEEEIKYLVERGDWELILTASAFQNRSPEGQIQLLREAMDKRIKQVEQTLNYLINRGPNQRAAAMGVLKRIKELRRLRDELLQHFYEQGQRSISDSTKEEKIEFY